LTSFRVFIVKYRLQNAISNALAISCNLWFADAKASNHREPQNGDDWDIKREDEDRRSSFDWYLQVREDYERGVGDLASFTWWLLHLQGS
jgi:hypothetical protein